LSQSIADEWIGFHSKRLLALVERMRLFEPNVFVLAMQLYQPIGISQLLHAQPTPKQLRSNQGIGERRRD
jgi:hypothetical protein